jgi:hypothetical protein
MPVAKFSKIETLARRCDRPRRGLIFWREILCHRTVDEFVEDVLRRDQASLSRAVAAHLYVLAGIADTKFWSITQAMRCLYIGAPLACLALLAA